MNYFERRKLKKAIKAGISSTMSLIKNREPKVVENFFYGAYYIAPQHLVIWYLFDTNKDLEIAKESGLTNEMIQNTHKVMIKNGYPQQAFVMTEFPLDLDKIKFANGTEEQQRTILENLSFNKASIAFTTRQDIQDKTGGDYRMYFQ